MIGSVSIFAFVIATLGISYQDFKARAIHVMLLAVLLVLGIWEAYRLQIPLQELLFSGVFTLFTLGGMWLYIGLKNQEFVNPLRQHIGLGDVVFFFVVIPFFSFYSFMLFFISGLILSLVLLVLLRKWITSDSIPLAGILSGYLLALKLVQWLFGINVLTSKMGLL